MHVTDAEGHAVAGTEVVPHAAAQHKGKREIPSLRVQHALGALRVNESDTAAQLKVGSSPPISVDKIAPHTQIEGPISCFRPSRNRSEGRGERQISIATKNPRTSYVAHVPSERRKDGYQSVTKRKLSIRVAYGKVEDKRNIDGKYSRFQGEFELVSVIDV